MDFIFKYKDQLSKGSLSTNLVNSSIERLYVKILVLGFAASIIMCCLHLFNWNTSELPASFLFLANTTLSLVLFLNNKKKLSYHVSILTVCLINTYMFIIQGADYKAILLIFPVSTLSTFIFFQRRIVLVFYFFIFLYLQAIIIYFALQPLEEHFWGRLIGEYVNMITFNTIAFLMCYYYFSSLQRAKRALDSATADVMLQQKQLKEQHTQLEAYIESNLQLESYTHLASHELKAPLQTLKGYTDVLSRKIESKLEPSEKKLLEYISNNSEKMTRLLNDLADLGSVSKTTLQVEQVSIDALFADILRDRQAAIQARNAIVQYEPSSIIIEGQSSILLQLFSNLVGNALKFVEKDKTPKVKITCTKKGELLEIRVADNGIGISPKNRDKIFQIFTRLHSEATFEGSGIGLAICKKIVDLHKGTIEVIESHWRGACFIVRLPLQQS